MPIEFAKSEIKDAEKEDKAGHAAHTKAADSQEGLRGKITRPINITFFGE